jgi:hypothetical protein
MRRTLTTTIIAGALLAAMAFGVPAASATPKRAACNKCHAKSSAVKIKLTRTSETTDTAEYAVKVSGGKGVSGWAVFAGTKNLKYATKTSGSFVATRGATYTVRAVKKRSGSAFKKITIP